MPAALLQEGRSIERLDPVLKTGDPIYLFNIYGCEFDQNLGTCGRWYIPACPEGKPYIRAPKAIDGTFEEIYPHFTDKEEFRSRARSGEEIAKAICGIGPGQSPNEDITKFGVFFSYNETPSKDELAKARAKLVKHLESYIRRGDELAASADANERKSVDESFYRAARFLNVKRPWMSEATEMTVCPFCTTPLKPSAVICPGCKEVINKAGYDALKAKIGA